MNKVKNFVGIESNLKKKKKLRTLSFFFLSGVMNPFLAFLALEASSRRARTSALLRSVSACFLFFSYILWSVKVSVILQAQHFAISSLLSFSSSFATLGNSNFCKKENLIKSILKKCCRQICSNSKKISIFFTCKTQ